MATLIEDPLTDLHVFLFPSGTSPHTAASVSVSTGLNQANVSWEPGFDGGYTQKFTVWLVSHPVLTVADQAGMGRSLSYYIYI